MWNKQYLKDSHWAPTKLLIVQKQVYHSSNLTDSCITLHPLALTIAFHLGLQQLESGMIYLLYVCMIPGMFRLSPLLVS